jgi:integrase
MSLHLLPSTLPVDLGRHSDGGALTLVNTAERRYWVFRFTVNGRDRRAEWSLKDYTLAQARERARQWRVMVADGTDPTRAGKLADHHAITFKQYAADNVDGFCVASRSKTDPKKAWERAFAQVESLHAIPVAQITMADVVKALAPHFAALPKKAERLRWRLERLFDAARSEGLIEGRNPAEWKGGLDGKFKEAALLAKRTEGRHASIEYALLPDLMRALATDPSIVARACEFEVLVALRGQEVRGAAWSEFKLDGDTPCWIVPRDRMKVKDKIDHTTGEPIPHIVPLSPAHVAFLKSLPTFGQDGLVFPSSQNRGQEISHCIMNICLRRNAPEGVDLTGHGMRATLTTWVNDTRLQDYLLAEQAQDRVIGTGTRRRYVRSAAFAEAELRRQLMTDWANYALSVPAANNVVAFPRAA